MPEQIKWTLLFCGVIVYCLNLVEGNRVGCFDNSEGFGKIQQKMLRAMLVSRHAPVGSANHKERTCKHFLSELSSVHLSSEIKHRSLAPWRTRIVEDPEMIPSRYEEAECLCDGCIINGAHNHSYNSVPVLQKMLFLKKVKCLSDPSKYSFKIEYKEVAVGCTCVAPRS
ncbi:interleukin-17C [Paramisgurnus dabryanus]|uniref:interleukin-17C n=1 Tax=Paramisgurnus dabryanus TaxID=90735 RepID=UPI0031F36324